MLVYTDLTVNVRLWIHISIRELYIYVCMYEYVMFVRIMCVSTNIYICKNGGFFMYVLRMHGYVYVSIYMCVCMDSCTYVGMHVFKCIYIRVYVYMYVCI